MKRPIAINVNYRNRIRLEQLLHLFALGYASCNKCRNRTITHIIILLFLKWLQIRYYGKKKRRATSPDGGFTVTAPEEYRQWDAHDGKHRDYQRHHHHEYWYRHFYLFWNCYASFLHHDARVETIGGFTLIGMFHITSVKVTVLIPKWNYFNSSDKELVDFWKVYL